MLSRYLYKHPCPSPEGLCCSPWLLVLPWFSFFPEPVFLTLHWLSLFPKTAEKCDLQLKITIPDLALPPSLWLQLK